jgi:hypothetical protein
MFIQDAPPDTSGYMIAGYTIFFILTAVYLLSLFIRTRNLNQDLTVLESLEKQSKDTANRSKLVNKEGSSRLAVKQKTTKKMGKRSNRLKKKVIKKK